MLQQTQVATVLPFYSRWMARFPTMETLARSSDDDVLSLWQGLGYYRRALLLRSGSQAIVEGGMPASAADWLKVPGVGRYTAGAIASITRGEAAAVVDGNVRRVFARLTASAAVGRALDAAAWIWADLNLDPARPGDWNQALMEMGAIICTPRKPRCGACPLRGHCRAYRLGSQSLLPTRTVSKPVPIAMQVFVHLWGSEVGLRRIPDREWWARMWGLPNRRHARIDGTSLGEIQHTVTKHRVRLSAQMIRVSRKNNGLTWFPIAQLQDIPLSAPHRRVLEIARDHLASGQFGQS